MYLHLLIDQSMSSSSCFNCKGRTNISNEEFVRNEQNYNSFIINDEIDQYDRCTLFGYSFHNGHSLVYDIPILFKMAKCVYLVFNTFFIIHFSTL